MAQIKFTRHLQRFFPTLQAVEQVEGRTVAEIVTQLDQRFPGLAGYLVDEQGSLRQHVNIFLGQTLIQDRRTLQDPVGEQDQLFIFQALSGGSTNLF